MVVVSASAAPVHAACDVTGADAAALAASRAAVDAACPCAAATSRGAYRMCGSAAIRSSIASTALPRGCKREALRHVHLSVCGRSGAAVCCRVRTDGKLRHGVVGKPASCATTPRFTACVSTWQSVAIGCDPTGCVPSPVCGNGILEAGETCDPPDDFLCSPSCHTTTCDPSPGPCGNGTIDAGEACEPPGVGSCTPTCQIAACPAPAAGEVAVACVDATTRVGAAATAAGYLVAWDAPYQRVATDVLARRFDADLVPTDPGVTVMSTGGFCDTSHTGPAVGSDGQDYYVAWNGYGGVPDIGAPIEAVYGRPLTGAGVGELTTLDFLVPFGQCQSAVFGPTTAAGGPASHFAAGWVVGGGCFPQGLLYQNPAGRLLDLGPPLMTSGVALGFPPFLPPPITFSASPASVASNGSDTLWVWHAAFAPAVAPPYVPFVAAVWDDGVASGILTLTGRGGLVSARPGVAAGASSFLVAWGQGATAATVVTEIRAVRATRASGNLDPDGGLLLGTAAIRITGGPVVAYDGARWLVAWAEALNPSGNELRAVAVRDDGTVVDASPRLVASGVAAQEPAVASAGDGRVAVVFVQPDGPRSTVRATLVTP
jgi:hypothetical protein